MCESSIIIIILACSGADLADGRVGTLFDSVLKVVVSSVGLIRLHPDRLLCLTHPPLLIAGLSEREFGAVCAPYYYYYLLKM